MSVLGCKISPRPNWLVPAVLPIDDILRIWPHPIGEVVWDVGWLQGPGIGLLVLVDRLGIYFLVMREIWAALLGCKPHYLGYIVLHDVVYGAPGSLALWDGRSQVKWNTLDKIGQDFILS